MIPNFGLSLGYLTTGKEEKLRGKSDGRVTKSMA
jgi:hypothetical protein